MTTTPLVDSDGNPPQIRRSAISTFVFPITDLSLDPAGPKVLTGATEVTFAIGHHRSSATRDLVLTLGQSPPAVTHDGVGGTVTVVITAEQAEALPVGNRWCELWVTDSAGRREVVGEGKCVVYDTLVPVEDA